MTRTTPRFDSYPDSDDDFDSDLLYCSSLTIMATPQSRVVYWKNSDSTGSLDNAHLVACLRDLPYQSGRPLSPIGEDKISIIARVDYSRLTRPQTAKCTSQSMETIVHLDSRPTDTPMRTWPRFPMMSCLLMLCKMNLNKTSVDGP